MLGWSFPELIIEAFRKLMQNSRLFNRDLSVVSPKTTIVTANAYSHKKELETHISNFVMRLVRHENRHDRETDEAIY